MELPWGNGDRGPLGSSRVARDSFALLATSEDILTQRCVAGAAAAELAFEKSHGVDLDLAQVDVSTGFDRFSQGGQPASAAHSSQRDVGVVATLLGGETEAAESLLDGPL